MEKNLGSPLGGEPVGGKVVVAARRGAANLWVATKCLEAEYGYEMRKSKNAVSVSFCRMDGQKRGVPDKCPLRKVFGVSELEAVGVDPAPRTGVQILFRCNVCNTDFRSSALPLKRQSVEKGCSAISQEIEEMLTQGWTGTD